MTATLLIAAIVAGAASAPVEDKMTSPELGAVRIRGRIGEKIDRFLDHRVFSEHARTEIVGEARQAFLDRDDDESGVGGLWRGEFWGKFMLSAARAAAYQGDEKFRRFLSDECRRLIATADDDGYIGSYADKSFVFVRDPSACKKEFGWLPNWNIWNRKYCLWAMLACYRETKDRDILRSVERQADQLIDMMHAMKRPLSACGAGEMNGLPPMSILKPLVLLARETGRAKYLDYAREMLPDWRRADGKCPNFFINAFSGKALHMWYPDPQTWAKSYELMSCLDGILEYYRMTGEGECLDAVMKIRDLLARYESNPLGGVAFGDKFIGAASRPDALSEVCDAIHWIRLNVDLYLITADERYLDAVEACWYNNFLAGVDRDGHYGAFMVRGRQRHEHDRQCGYAYNHCCVNNIPRSFFDFASILVTRDKTATFHVNDYVDSDVAFDGTRFEIRGGFPISDKVTVRVEGPGEIRFRKPFGCRAMDVQESVRNGVRTYDIIFDMPAKLVASAPVVNPQKDGMEATDRWALNRYGVAWQNDVNADVRKESLRTAAYAVWKGPVLLARARRLGAREAELKNAALKTIGADWRVETKPCATDKTFGAWHVTLTSPDGTDKVETLASDYQSAADYAYADGDWFSVWFGVGQ